MEDEAQVIETAPEATPAAAPKEAPKPAPAPPKKQENLVQEKLHILICLFSGLLCGVTGLLSNAAPNALAARMLITMTAFFIIGLIVRGFLRKALAPPPEPEAAAEEGAATEEGESALADEEI